MMTAAMLQCPNDLDERMELYCLDRMRPAEARELESHMAACPACLYESMGTDLFLESLVLALHECEQGRRE